MKESIHKYFKVGILSFMSYPAADGENPNIVENIKKCACDDYFDVVEITWIKDEAKRAQVRRILETANVTVGFAGQPCLLNTGLNPNDLDEAGRQAAEDLLIREIDEAYSMGAKAFACMAGRWQEETRDEAYAQLLKTTLNICNYAKTKDMTIVMEVYDFDVDRKTLIGPAPYAAKFAADVRTYCDNFGLMIDLTHIPLTRETSEFVMRVLAPYAMHFHIGNSVPDPNAEGYGDGHQRFGFPNGANGLNEVLAFLRALKKEGFFCPEDPYILSLEVRPWKDEDPDVVLAGAKRMLNRAWALLED